MLVKGALLLMMALLVPLFGAARCYPAGTRVIIFLEGIYSERQADEPPSYDGFRAMKQAFVARGYDPAKLLDFSYMGGTFDDADNWRPNPYTCDTTDRPSAVNLRFLEEMIQGYRARYPNAHFTLIGHSLGGYLAFLEGVREAERAPDQRLDVDAVIALDSPLNGLDVDKKIVLDMLPCTKTYQAGLEIVADKQNPSLAALRQSQVAAMTAAGVRLATLGNLKDCLYEQACHQGFSDDTPTQFIDGAPLVRRYVIPSSPFASHFVVLTFAQALADITAFVGAP